jgi:hypothetical protein
MKRKSLIELSRMPSAPSPGRFQAMFARSAQIALEISEAIGLKCSAVRITPPLRGD